MLFKALKSLGIITRIKGFFKRGVVIQERDCHAPLLDHEIKLSYNALFGDRHLKVPVTLDIWRFKMKRTLQRNVRRRKKKHGFLKRMKTKGGKRVIGNRRRKKRRKVSV